MSGASDYFRFIEALQAIEHPNYVLQNVGTELESLISFTKIRRNGTAFTEKEVVNLSIHSGVFVDIFPLTPIPENEAEARRYHREGRLLTHLLIGKTSNKVSRELSSWPDCAVLAVRKIMHLLLKLISKRYLYQKYLEWLNRYDESSGLYVDVVAKPFVPIRKTAIDPLAQGQFGTYTQRFRTMQSRF